jgi:hypothetical protein
MAIPVQPELDFDFYLPAGRETFRTWEVAAIIRHSEDHVINLIEAKEFGDYVDARGAGASKSSYVITRAGLVAWLTKRKR